jgi:hypothetical protein
LGLAFFSYAQIFIWDTPSSRSLMYYLAIETCP